MFHMDLYNAKCIIGLDRKDNMINVYFFYKSTFTERIVIFFTKILYRFFYIFQFLCYPWQDDSQVAAKDRIPICRKDKDCKEGKECYRHTDKRRVSKGLCLDKVCLCKLTLPKPKYIYYILEIYLFNLY